MKNKHAAALGSIRSEAKARAARENGKLGGRPKKVFTESMDRFGFPIEEGILMEQDSKFTTTVKVSVGVVADAFPSAPEGASLVSDEVQLQWMLDSEQRSYGVKDLRIRVPEQTLLLKFDHWDQNDELKELELEYILKDVKVEMHMSDVKEAIAISPSELEIENDKAVLHVYL